MPALSSQALLLLLLLLGIVVDLLVLALLENRSDRMARRARDLAAAQSGEANGASSRNRKWTDQVLAVIGFIGDHTPLFNAEQRQKVMNQLALAGFRHRYNLSIFLCVKFATGGVLMIIMVFASEALPHLPPILRFGIIGLGLISGLILPEGVLKRIVRRRQKLLNHALPDTLDLLVICTNAGYSLGASIQRVASELGSVYPVMAGELQTTAHELQVMGEPVTVLRRFAERTQLPSIRSLVATLIQTQQYGTPITQALRTLAQSERSSRMLSMEERAAKLSVKITFPMMIFILPTVMIIATGPAIIKLLSTFGN